MNKELDEKLVKDFPLLYKDRYKSMMSTAMYWGFDCSAGWEPIIRRLSEKLEPLIQKYYKENKDNIRCSVCGCKRDDHYASATNKPGKCLAIRRMQTKFFYCKWGNWKYWWQRSYYEIKQKVFRIINWVLGRFCYKLHTCWCEEYDPSIPCASQVKEKFGGLRVYTTFATDEMDDLIREAEKESEVTCELCGDPGVLRLDGGWYMTRCDKCAIDRDGNRIPTYEECIKEDEI